MAGRLAPGRRRQGRPARPARHRPARAPRARAGCGSGPAWPGSAAPTWPPSTARRRAGSSRSCRSRSRRATRSSATSTTTRRVVVVPVLSCVARASRPRAGPARRAASTTASGSAHGSSSPGLQCGFCETTGGGWSHADGGPRVPARRRCPTRMSDEAAVLVEPTACAVHAAAQVDGRDRVGRDRRGHARPAHHRRAAAPLGPTPRSSPPPSTRTSGRWPPSSAPTSVVDAGRARPGRAVPHRLDAPRLRAAHRRHRGGGRLRRLRRVDRPGPARSPLPAARSTRSACPGVTTVDLTPLWQREVALRGAYAYQRADFDDRAIALVAELDLGRLVSATYPLKPLRGRHRPRRLRRPPRRREDRLRPPRRTRENTSDAPSRIRPRGRPLDPADPVPPRRGLPSREAARRPQPRALPRPSRSRRSTTPTRAIRRRAREPARRQPPAAGLLLTPA